MFPPSRMSRWLGKEFDDGLDGLKGWNLFEGGRDKVLSKGSSVRARYFDTTLVPSVLDGAPALCLKCRDGWPRFAGMRDELRKGEGGVLLGLGSMVATGGVKNPQPFVLQPMSPSAETE